MTPAPDWPADNNEASSSASSSRVASAQALNPAAKGCAARMQHAHVRLTACVAVVLLIIGCCTAPAQLRATEVFAGAGLVRVSGDEGWLGSGWTGAAILTQPFLPRWALESAFSYCSAERHEAAVEFETDRRVWTVGIQHRWGRPSIYGFASFGIGYSWLKTGTTFLAQRVRFSEDGVVLSWWGGVVKQLARPWLLRVEVFTVFPHALPDVGLRGSIGWRVGKR